MRSLKRLFDRQLLKRSIVFWWQRWTRGWDDSETWSMDSSLAKIILPTLQVYQDMNTMFPWSLTMETWNKIIAEMVWGFQWFADGKQHTYDYNKEADQANRAHDAIELFAKYYKYLWYSVPKLAHINDPYVWGSASTISTQIYLAKLILPRLKRFQEVRMGYPANMTDEEWEVIIAEMMWGFERYANDTHSLCTDNETKRLQYSIELFGKYYGHLWW